MRVLAAAALIISLGGFLSGCDTTTTPPDISSLQPTPQEQNQEYIQKSLQS
jgi:outer membrane PBP1 activator LpoA protein